jgi:hypothetical protein
MRKTKEIFTLQKSIQSKSIIPRRLCEHKGSPKCRQNESVDRLRAQYTSNVKSAKCEPDPSAQY